MTFMEVLDGTIVNVALPTMQVELGVEATFTALGAMAPTRAVPRDWFLPDMRGARVLGLASGGGQQMPLFAAMGAVCTVLDYSERQIASERMVAEREGYEIRCVRADMTRPLLFEDGEFDLILHPVSNCYAEDVLPIWREGFRVLAPGGRLLGGLDNGFNYMVDDEELVDRGRPFNPLRDPSLIPEDELGIPTFWATCAQKPVS